MSARSGDLDVHIDKSSFYNTRSGKNRTIQLVNPPAWNEGSVTRSKRIPGGPSTALVHKESNSIFAINLEESFPELSTTLSPELS